MDFDVQALSRILLAGALGGIVGLEREMREKPAGLRTHILVGMAACLLVAIARHAVVEVGAPGAVEADPLRIVQTTVLGISFLGAGTIFVRRGTGRVGGLTTAATILMTAALGLSVGLGMWQLACVVTICVVGVLTAVGRFESYLHGGRLPSHDAAERAGHRVADALPRGA